MKTQYSLRTILVLFLFASHICEALEQQWQLDSGYLWRDGNDQLGSEEYVSLRYNLESSVSNGRVIIHYQLGNINAPNQQQEDYSYRVVDLDFMLIDGEVSQNLDRFLYQHYWHSTDLSLGRQAISLGNARFSSNVDVFDPNLIGALQTDYRAGVDAIRFEHMLSFDDRGLSLLDGAWLGNSQGYARFRSNIHETDTHLTYVTVNDNEAVSFALDGAVKELGYWLVLNHLQDSDNSLFTLQGGIDFSWHDFLYQIEISQRESSDPDLLLDLLESRMLPYGDEQYAFANATYLSGVRSQFQLAVAHNSRINSQLWSARYQYSINDQWDAWLQMNTHDGLYARSSTDAFSFQHAGHLISVNIKGVF